MSQMPWVSKGSWVLLFHHRKILSNTSFGVFFEESFVPMCSMIYIGFLFNINLMFLYISSVAAPRRSVTFTLILRENNSCLFL